jgi:putative phosphoesterase
MSSATRVGVRIGVISDTHNLVRPEALLALQGCEHIIHAGDICKTDVLDALGLIAPIIAIRGNNDSGVGIDELPEARRFSIAEKFFYLVHDIAHVPRILGSVDVVITGHSHKPLVEQRGRTLYVNPGSAGPRRFKLPVTLGIMTINGADIDVDILPLVE